MRPSIPHSIPFSPNKNGAFCCGRQWKYGALYPGNTSELCWTRARQVSSSPRYRRLLRRTAVLLGEPCMTQPATCLQVRRTDIMEDQKENRPLHNWACEEDELCRTMKSAEISGRVSESPEGGTCSTKTTVTDFSDPVYKEISYSNGCVNRMSKDELKAKLTELKLDTRGVKNVLKKRLKNYYKKQKLKVPSDTAPYYDYICVIDFEATCEDGNPPDYIHEIIEFPIALVNTRTLEIEDIFQRYVKPEINLQLSEFCVNLTGITQELVDQADTFPVVLQSAVDWMRQKDLGTKFKYAILTDGSWDMSKFLNMQCHISDIKYPRFAKKWCNIRKCYGNFYKVPRGRTKLTTMLEKLGMRFDGRLHSGLDDSKNIARIAIRMLQDGCELRMNERLHAGQLMTVSSSLPLEGAAVPQNPQFKK